MTKSDDVSQMGRFIAAARQAECDESEAAFEDKLRRIAKAKPAVDDTLKDQEIKP